MVPVRASRTVGMTTNRKIVRLLFGLLLVIQPALCVSAEESECRPPREQFSDRSPGTNREHFKQQFTVAEHLRQMAAAAGAEWLETEGLLASSQEEAGNGEWSTALQLVQKACLQAELALQQAKYESVAWKKRVVN